MVSQHPDLLYVLENGPTVITLGDGHKGMLIQQTLIFYLLQFLCKTFFFLYKTIDFGKAKHISKLFFNFFSV